MRKSIICTFTLLLGLTLAGCSAHYRRSLADYKRNEPTPFLQQTLKWTGEPGAAAPAAGAKALKDASLEAVRAELGQPDDVFIKVVADVLALTTETVRRELAPLRDAAALRRRLADTLTFRELSLAVALYNPAVQAGRESWQAALRQFEQAEFLETLIGEYRTFTRYLYVEPGSQMNRQMAQTFFPSPSTMALKGEMVRQMARMAHEEWQMTLREQTVEAGGAFYEYQYIGRATVVTRENIDLVRGLLKVVEDGYRAGSATQADLLKLQTTMARQENELRDLESMRAAQAGKINGLLGRGPSEPLGAPEDKDHPRVSLGLEEFIERALRERQEVQIQQARAERTRIAIRMGEVMNRPLATRGYSMFERGMMGEAAPEVGAMEPAQSAMDESAARDGMGDGSESGPSFGLRPKVNARPLYAQAESYLAEMRQRHAAERAQLAQVIAQTRSQARVMFEDLGVTLREVELVQGVVLPQNQSAYDTTLAAYTSGNATFLELLDSERMLLESRLELQRARRDLNKAAVNLAMIAGQLIWP